MLSWKALNLGRGGEGVGAREGSGTTERLTNDLGVNFFYAKSEEQ